MKLKRIPLSPEGLANALRTGSRIEIVGDGVPIDGRVVRVFANHETGNIELVVESELYDDLPVGGLIPHAPPIMFRHDKEA